MGMTGLNVIDRDLKSQTIGLIAFDTPKSIVTRFLMTGMVAAFTGQAASSYFFPPPQTQIDTLFKKHKPATIGNRYVELNYSYENDLHNFQLQNPLSGTDKGSIRKFDECLSNLAAKPNLLFFMFTQTQHDDVWRELKYLHTKYSSPLIIAMYSNLFGRNPTNALPACVDYAIQLTETPNLGCKATPFRSKTTMPTSSPASQHPIYTPEEFVVDANDLYVSSTPKSTQLTLAEVDAELYDLRGFDAQRAAPDKIKTLLKRRQELTGNNKRPSFMS